MTSQQKSQCSCQRQLQSGLSCMQAYLPSGHLYSPHGRYTLPLLPPDSVVFTGLQRALSLAFIDFRNFTDQSLWKSNKIPKVNPSQRSRAGPGVELRVGLLDPRAWKQKNWARSLLPATLDELARAVLESSPKVVWMRESWPVQLRPGPEPGL